MPLSMRETVRSSPTISWVLGGTVRNIWERRKRCCQRMVERIRHGDP